MTNLALFFSTRICVCVRVLRYRNKKKMNQNVTSLYIDVCVWCVDGSFDSIRFRSIKHWLFFLILTTGQSFYLYSDCGNVDFVFFCFGLDRLVNHKIHSGYIKRRMITTKIQNQKFSSMIVIFFHYHQHSSSMDFWEM